MKTATVRELRNHYADLLALVETGEEIVITRRGKAVARIIPEPLPQVAKIDWANAPEVTWDRSGETLLTAQQVSDLLHDASGKW